MESNEFSPTSVFGLINECKCAIDEVSAGRNFIDKYLDPSLYIGYSYHCDFCPSLNEGKVECSAIKLIFEKLLEHAKRISSIDCMAFYLNAAANDRHNFIDLPDDEYNENLLARMASIAQNADLDKARPFSLEDIALLASIISRICKNASMSIDVIAQNKQVLKKANVFFPEKNNSLRRCSFDLISSLLYEVETLFKLIEEIARCKCTNENLVFLYVEKTKTLSNEGKCKAKEYINSKAKEYESHKSTQRKA